MVFYNEKGNKLRIDLGKNKYIYNDHNGNVYYDYNGLWIKDMFYPSIEDLELIWLMKDLKLKGFCEINDILFDKYGRYKGYTMKGINRENLNLLTMPVSYILDNLYNIFTSVITLSYNNIYVNGLVGCNALMDEREITIYNVDSYRICDNVPISNLINDNILLLKVLFKDILSDSIYRYNIDDSYKYINIIKELCVKINSSGINEFVHELDGYKYPMDYIKKKINNRR